MEKIKSGKGRSKGTIPRADLLDPQRKLAGNRVLMGNYLEDYLQTVTTLPLDLRENFVQMHELDTKSQMLVERIEKESRRYVNMARSNPDPNAEPDEELLERIRDDLRECLEFSDQKVALASKTFELVDQHLKRLNHDLAKFEKELNNGEAVSTRPLQPKNTLKKKRHAVDRDSVGGGGSKSAADISEPPTPQSTVPPRKKKHTASHAHSHEELVEIAPSTPATHDYAHAKHAAKEASKVSSKKVAAVPAEPLPVLPPYSYCICKTDTGEDMVGCDNEACPNGEWFHYSCVGLTASDVGAGEWYCPGCQAARAGGKKRGRKKKSDTDPTFAP